MLGGTEAKPDVWSDKVDSGLLLRGPKQKIDPNYEDSNDLWQLFRLFRNKVQLYPGIAKTDIYGNKQGCGVGVETGVGVGRSRLFWLESEL